ncbi:MAG: NIPSNAP family containing protein, partial [Acidobacteria bacterium]
MLTLTRLIETLAKAGTEPMNRRAFLKTSVGATAVAGVLNAPTQSQREAASAKAREYYELRQYHVQSGRQQKLTDAFLKEAFVPALNRLGIASVGVFTVTIGPVTPTFYVLIAAASVETLATVEGRLDQDAEYLKAGAPFLTSPADQAPFIRIESSLMVAFEGWPKLKLPAATTEHKERMFELRTYESPSD